MDRHKVLQGQIGVNVGNFSAQGFAHWRWSNGMRMAIKLVMGGSPGDHGRDEACALERRQELESVVLLEQFRPRMWTFVRNDWSKLNGTCFCRKSGRYGLGRVRSEIADIGRP